MKGKRLTEQDIKELKIEDEVWFDYKGKEWNVGVCNKLHVVKVNTIDKHGVVFIDDMGYETKSTKLNKEGYEIEVYENIDICQDTDEYKDIIEEVICTDVKKKAMYYTLWIVSLILGSIINHYECFNPFLFGIAIGSIALSLYQKARK